MPMWHKLFMSMIVGTMEDELNDKTQVGTRIKQEST